MTLTYDEFVRGSKQANDEFMLHVLQARFGREFDLSHIWDFEEPVNYEDLKSGDILYFDFGGSEVLVGLALTDYKFIYVSSYGIKESELNSMTWSKRLTGIRRIKQGANV